MSSGASTSTAASPPKRPSQRAKLRNGTFIIPRTGERSRRQFSLRTSSSLAVNEEEGYRSFSLAETFREYTATIVHNVRHAILSFWRWLHTDEAHGVIKCTLAYLLGSMGTFFPPLSNYLGNRDGKHITATLTVYFHASRTMGSMLEAVLIAFVAVLYAEVISLLSMGIAIGLQAHLGLTALSHILVLLVCLGAALGFVGWVKQRLNNPLVNVGTTLTSIAIISVVTKEESVQGGYFSDDKIMQVMKMLVIGISFTAAMNVLAWPISARRVLRKSLMKASTALSDKLSCITQGFLNGTEDKVGSEEYSRVTGQWNSAYSLMAKTLREAKFEHYFVGRESMYPIDRRLVRSMESLAQAIGGLRSSLDTQFTLLREVPGQVPDPDLLSPTSPLPSPLTRSSYFGEDPGRLAVINESTESDEESPMGVRSKSESTLRANTRMPAFNSPSDIIALFIELLGPSIKSLAFTLAEILREPVLGKDLLDDIKTNEQLRESLRDAQNLYNNARSIALQELYRTIEMDRSRSEKIQADIEEVAAACGHFSFSLLTVTEETDAYLDVIEDLKYMVESRRRSWNFLKFWRYIFDKPEKAPMADLDPERENLLPRPTVKRLRKSQVPKGIPDTMVKRRDTFNWEAAPQASRVMRLLSQKLLSILRVLARDDILFGIKVGIGAVLWAMFAFIPATRPVYQTWRGEWGLLSFMIVSGMTTGASNTTGTHRFKGTIIGAAFSCVAWTVSQGNPWALAFLGWLIACCMFYVILVVKNAPLGRTALLAYNVSTLYAYSISQQVDDDDDDEGGNNPLIFDIAYHRVTAVTLGIVWGIVVCRLLWPISGRRKFREGLSVLYLQLGLIWKRGPLGIMYQSNTTMDYMREGEQEALQRYAFKLDTLRASAKSEFELRGPFPDKAYDRIMHSTKHILDGFYAMRLVSQKRSKLSDGERTLLEFTAKERALLCQRICHVFQVLASCIMLEYPLTDAVPTVEGVKDRLLGKIYQFRREHMATRAGSSVDSDGTAAASSAMVVAEETDYALLYAYILVTTQVAAELKKVRDEIESLFGVLHEESLLLQ